MIEAKASRTRKRKETVFNEKKTVRDFGSSFGMSAMAEESVQARFTDYDQCARRNEHPLRDCPYNDSYLDTSGWL